MMDRQHRRVELLGVEVDALTMEESLDLAQHLVEAAGSTTNSHRVLRLADRVLGTKLGVPEFAHEQAEAGKSHVCRSPTLIPPEQACNSGPVVQAFSHTSAAK